MVEGADGIVDECVDLIGIAHIHHAGDDARAQPVDRLRHERQPIGVAIAHGHGCAEVGEGERDGLADPLGRTRDQRDLSFERNVFRPQHGAQPSQ